ncbi:MAG: tRNA dihydrouridine synthase DusB [Spirochaetaceae bacterium]|nr:tRNA dihydrouridine synthase DusB [Spirochaetaceae bacterium]
MSNKEYLLHPLIVGNIEIKGNLFLAPLAGYTDKSFRTLCIENGADLTISEMVSSEGIARGNQKTVKLMERADIEKNFSIQIFSGNLDSVQRGFDALLAFNPTIIDINCGCPVPKVTKTGAGSALMKDPKTMGSIVNFLTTHTDIPVSIKFRTGWDLENENYIDFAKTAIDNGVNLIAMHARTKTQGYAPTAHWDRLENLVNIIHREYKDIPVIGSGDIFSALDAFNMLNTTGVDGIMAARGAIGNPCIFNQVKQYVKTGSYNEISIEDRITLMKHQLELMSADIGEDIALREMRKHCCAYIKGFPGSSKVKMELMGATTKEDYNLALSHLI